MKLIIQIPCLNETTTLPAVLQDLPTHIPGVTSIEKLVIDDGSTDGTAELAAASGVDYVVRHAENKGLAAAFQTGIDACLRRGADIIVNTDGDHQYPGAAIPDLIAPILDGEADIVIGDRQVDRIDHFSGQKKLLQKLGSWVVRQASDTDVPDAPSGFRAYSREAALRLFVTNDFSYTVENVIQAGRRRLTVAHIPISTNPQTRPPRLHQGSWGFVKRQAGTITRTFTYYEPLRSYTYLAAPFLLAGLILLGRFLLVYTFGNAYQRLLQSVTIGAALLVIGFLIFVVGLLADAVANHRRLTEEVLYRVRKLDSERDALNDLRQRIEALEEALPAWRDGNSDRTSLSNVTASDGEAVSAPLPMQIGYRDMTTGYTFDDTFLAHKSAGHPESPDRLRAILNLLEESGVRSSLTLVEPEPVDLALLEQVHAPRHISLVQRMSETGGGHLDVDTYVNQASWDAARLAAGGTVMLTEAVLRGDLDNAFAFVRPPGHHAETQRGMGFCLFNNVAVAAQAALNANLKRVLIVDFDVHHGNGTQEIFYARPDVLYFSTHQYPFYPGTGAAEEIGTGEGQGYTVNAPLRAGTDDTGYATVFEELLVPVARRFDPDLVLVSAGYDAHWQDPLAAMRVTVEGFARMVSALLELAAELCDGRLVMTLEGGYDLEALSHGVVASLRVLLGDEVEVDPLGPTPHPVRPLSSELIQRLRRIHGL